MKQENISVMASIMVDARRIGADIGEIVAAALELTQRELQQAQRLATNGHEYVK